MLGSCRSEPIRISSMSQCQKSSVKQPYKALKYLKNEWKKWKKKTDAWTKGCVDVASDIQQQHEFMKRVGRAFRGVHASAWRRMVGRLAACWCAVWMTNMKNLVPPKPTHADTCR